MHLIQSHHINFSCYEKALAMQVKEQLPIVLQQEFYPKLEKLLDRYDRADQVHEIAKLLVKISVVNPKDWKNDLIQQGIDQITAFLKSQQFKNSLTILDKETREHAEVVTKTRSAHLQELFLDYLKKGVLPSNAIVQSLGELLQKVKLDAKFSAQLLELLSEKNTTLLRWFLNIPEQVKEVFIARQELDFDQAQIATVMKALSCMEIREVLGVNSDYKLKEFVTFLYWNYMVKRNIQASFYQKTANELKTIAQAYFGIPLVFFKTVISKFYNQDFGAKNSFEHYVYTVSEQLIETTNSQGDLQTVFEEFNDLQRGKNGVTLVKESAIEKLVDGVFIKNAGLILLHPFLFPLFKKLGYLRDREWKSTQLQHRAVLITQYLVNFENAVEESELLFNKLLCGVPQTAPIAINWTIDPEEERQCRSLLESVIEHWKILKKTSPEGLQHTFLQREGKLTKLKNGNYQLTVSQTGVDVLLDQLPWGLGMIKTPWMEHFIDCIWN